MRHLPAILLLAYAAHLLGPGLGFWMHVAGHWLHEGHFTPHHHHRIITPNRAHHKHEDHHHSPLVLFWQRHADDDGASAANLRPSNHPYASWQLQPPGAPAPVYCPQPPAIRKRSVAECREEWPEDNPVPVDDPPPERFSC